MSEIDLMEKQGTPTLTFEPFGETKEVTPVVQEQKPVEEVAAFDESTLTTEERKMVDDFASKIELNNSNMILQFGAGAQKKMADFSESALNNVQSKDLGEIGTMLSSVVTELKSFEEEEEEKGILGFFKKSSNKITAMKAKYAKAEVNVNRICQVLEGHQVQLLKDVAMLDKMYDLN